jgi:hypothetical protein
MMGTKIRPKPLPWQFSPGSELIIVRVLCSVPSGAPSERHAAQSRCEGYLKAFQVMIVDLANRKPKAPFRVHWAVG